MKKNIGNLLSSSLLVLCMHLSISCIVISPAHGKDLAGEPINYDGIGIVLAISDCMPRIVEILDGSPASFNRHIEAGQYLLAVADGGGSGIWTNVTNLTLVDTAKLIRGKRETVVALKLADLSPLGLSSICVVEVIRGNTKGIRSVGVMDTNIDLPNNRRILPILTNSVYLSQTNQPKCTMVGDRQPDYRTWQSLQEGMTTDSVVEQLGEPIKITSLNSSGGSSIYCYGTVGQISNILPYQPEFKIWFTNGCIMSKEDPFDGVFSSNGLPNVPKLISPSNEQQFTQYPRVLDLRWYPVSGNQKMLDYEVQVDTRLTDKWASETYYVRSSFVSVLFSGANIGRWRVRARNELGQGDWSNYAFFRFHR